MTLSENKKKLKLSAEADNKHRSFWLYDGTTIIACVQFFRLGSGKRKGKLTLDVTTYFNGEVAFSNYPRD